jgi:simple sugar transport system ATP-binding protein
VVRHAPASELDEQALVSAMIQHDVAFGGPAAGAVTKPSRSAAAAKPRIVATGLRRASSQGALRDVSLTVHEGERVGVTGLLSAGVATLGRVLAGMELADAGEVRVDDRRVRSGDRRAALRAGIGYVPADRAAEGFVGQLSVAENETMTIVGRLSSSVGLLRPRARREAAAPMSEAMSVIASGPDQPVSELSGGNQQKVVVGRALIHDPAVIVAVTPTRGVDIAAKALLLDALGDEARRTGAALLVASDELDDVMRCDRVMVLVRGEVFAEFTPPYDRTQLIAATEGLGTPQHLYG